MKKYTLIVICIAIYCSSAKADEIYQVTTQKLNIRKEIGGNSKPFGYIPFGEKISVIDKSNQSWYKVRTKNGEGYVSSKYLLLVKEGKNEKKISNKEYNIILACVTLLIIIFAVIISIKPNTNFTINYRRFFTILGVSIILVLFYNIYNKETNSIELDQITGFFTHTQDKEDIKIQIEKTYFGIVNGAYTSEGIQGIGPSGLPFYNQNIGIIYIMRLLPFVSLYSKFNLEPKNIIISNITRDSAEVTYNLIVTSGEKSNIVKVNMTVKKIGGSWKLDGKNAFGEKKSE